MLEKEYLVYGLNALSRAHTMDYFQDGHRGAAIIAAYFLCHELSLEPGTVDIIRSMIDQHWRHTALCAPLPKETPEPSLINEIIKRVEQSITHLRQAGHNVIFPTLALKAFHQVPEAVTPSRILGICQVVEAFTVVHDINLDDTDNIPDLGSPTTAAEFILTELLRTIQAFDDRGQGWSGHLLTYGRALLDLQELGYAVLARKGEYAFKLYIKRIRMGPLTTDKPRPEHPLSALRPHELTYWKNRQDKSIALGHVFKYPYGFYKLLNLTEDSQLRWQCIQAAYHIF